MNANDLHKLCGGNVSLQRCQELMPGLRDVFHLANLNSVARRAMFFAQVLEESGGLRWTEELSSGTQYNGRADLGNTHPGDGPRYKGRGFIQLTGRHNYGAFGQWAKKRGVVDNANFFVNNPRKVANNKFAWISAGFYWVGDHDHGYDGHLNTAADHHDIVAATYMVNGGQNGIDTRRMYYQKALQMGKELM